MQSGKNFPRQSSSGHRISMAPRIAFWPTTHRFGAASWAACLFGRKESSPRNNPSMSRTWLRAFSTLLETWIPTARLIKRLGWFTLIFDFSIQLLVTYFFFILLDSPKRYQLGELVDYIFRVIRRDKEKGYFRYDMRFDPFFALKVCIHVIAAHWWVTNCFRIGQFDLHDAWMADRWSGMGQNWKSNTKNQIKNSQRIGSNVFFLFLFI